MFNLNYSVIAKVVYNLLRIPCLRLKHGIRVQAPMIQLLSCSTSINIGKGQLIMGEKISTFSNVHLSTGKNGLLKIGSHTFFNRNCIVVARKQIVIGERCLFGPNVSIYDHDHKFGVGGVQPNEYNEESIVIGNGCWIGANVVILRGTRLGDGCIVGAGTVLKGEYPSKVIIKGTQSISITQMEYNT